MPRPPKDPAIRQRRNKAATRAKLAASPTGPVPPLPAKGYAGKRGWNTLTRQWWADVWRSPMATKFLRADLHGLYMLAALVDQFWTAPHPQLAGEIRLQGQRFGLSPIDRWRLQWELRDTPPAAEAPKPQAVTPPPADDPRNILRAVK